MVSRHMADILAHILQGQGGNYSGGVIGVYGEANGTAGSRYGVYGFASGGTFNAAGLL